MAWYDTAGNAGDVVIASRASLTRNIEGYPFGERLCGDAREELIALVTAALSGVGLTSVNLTELEPAARNVLAEKRLISPDFAAMEVSRVLLLNEERGLSVEVGGRDHVKITALLPGAAVGEAYSSASDIGRLLDKSCELAYSEELGYLTGELTFLGTAAEFSMLLHLPALGTELSGERSDEAEAIVENLASCALRAKRLPGELWLISSPPFPGITETEQLSRLTGLTERIAAAERESRAKLRDDPEKLCDRVMRAYSIISNARLMTIEELLPLWSSVRLGAVMGFELPSPEELGAMLMSALPACLPSGCVESTRADSARAEMLRRRCSGRTRRD